MKTLLKLKYLLLLLGVTAMASCSSDKEDWTPGPQAKEGCSQVYFAAANEGLAIFDAADPTARTVSLTIERKSAQGAVTVPLTVKCTEGLEVPSSVTFAAGQTTALLTVAAPADVKDGTAFDYEITLTGDEVDPYAKVNGSLTFSGTISFPKVRYVKMWADGMENELGVWKEKVLDLGGGKYLINDLMESGLDLTLTLNDNNGFSLASPRWASWNIYDDNGAITYYCNDWDDALGQYVYYPFYPHGSGCFVWIEELELYTAPGYAGYNPSTGLYFIYMSNVKLNTERSVRSWVYLCFEFLADGEEFTPTVPTQPAAPTTKPVKFTVHFYDATNSTTFGGDFEVDAVQEGDNSYVFENFFQSGIDVVVDVDRTTGVLTLSGGSTYYYGGYWYCTDSSGNYAPLYPNWQSGVQENYITSFSVYEDSTGQYTGWDETDQAFQLYSYFYTNLDSNTQCQDYIIFTLKQ